MPPTNRLKALDCYYGPTFHPRRPTPETPPVTDHYEQLIEAQAQHTKDLAELDALRAEAQTLRLANAGLRGDLRASHLHSRMLLEDCAVVGVQLSEALERLRTRMAGGR